MTQLPTTATKKYMVIGFLTLFSILIIWKAALFRDHPVPGWDDAVSLSQTYATLRGDFLHNTFEHGFMNIDQLPYGFGLTSAFIIGLMPFGSTYNIFAFYLIIAVSLLVLGYIYLNLSPHQSILLTFAVLIALYNSAFLGGRSKENINVILILVTMILLRTMPKQSVLLTALISLLTTLAGLVHPYGGAFSVLLVAMIFWQEKRPAKYFIFYCLGIGIWLTILYLPIILLDVHGWITNFLGFFTSNEPRGFSNSRFLQTFIIYWSSNPIPFILLFLCIFLVYRSKRLAAYAREIGLLVIHILFLSFGARAYYFAYLLPYLLWRLSVLPVSVKLPNWVAVIIGLYILGLINVLPTIQQLENRQYVDTYKQILSQVESYSDIAKTHRIWISATIALPIIDKVGTRAIFWYYTGKFIDKPIKLESGDVILYVADGDKQRIQQEFDLPSDKVVEEIIVPPVEGFITSSSLFKKRSPPIYLAKIVLKDS